MTTIVRVLRGNLCNAAARSASRLAFLLAIVWGSVYATPAWGQEQGVLSDRSLHIFVIDHSSSMMQSPVKTKERTWETRWQFVEAKTREWLASMPTDGTADVILLLFNQEVPGTGGKGAAGSRWELRLDRWSPQSLARADQFINDVGRPKVNPASEGTALWNALGLSIKRIRETDGMYATSFIYLFTDGEDRHSKKVVGDDLTFPVGAEGIGPLEQQWRRLVKERESVYLIEQPLGDMEPPLMPEEKEPLNRHIYLNRPELSEPLRVSVKARQSDFASLVAAQSVPLQVQLAGPGKKRLPSSAPKVEVDFKADDPAVLVVIEPKQIDLADGTPVLSLKVVGGDAKKEIKGKLRLTYPADVDRVQILGVTELPLRFEAKQTVSIAWQQPVVDTSTPFQRPISDAIDFRVSHTGEAVEWDFGDGSPKVVGGKGTHGHKHTYKVAGTYEVRALATAPDRDPAEVKLRVQVVAADLVIELAGEAPVVGVSTELRAVATGLQAVSYDWTVDGAAVSAQQGQPSTLRTIFREPGAHKVRLVSMTNLGRIDVEKTVDVGPGISLAFAEDYYAVMEGQEQSFKAIVKGATDDMKVDWTLAFVDGKVIHTYSGAVRNEAASTPAWRMRLDLQPLPETLVLRASVAMDDAMRKRYGGGRSIEQQLKFEKLDLYPEKEFPADGGEFVLDEGKEFRAAWRGPKVDEVKWLLVEDGVQRDAKLLKANQSPEKCGSAYTFIVPAGEVAWTVKFAVKAVPIVGGKEADEDKWVVWEQLPVRLPHRVYELDIPAEDFRQYRKLKYDSDLIVGVRPVEYVKSVRWDWGDGKSEDVRPSEQARHRYAYDQQGTIRAKATVTRDDGSTVELPLVFEHDVPSFRISNPPTLRIGRNTDFEILPAELGKRVKEVRWQFEGAEFLETDLKTTHSFRLAGPSVVRATLMLEDGSLREVPELTANVVASRDVIAKPTVDGGESYGGVTMYPNVDADSDYQSIEIDILRGTDKVKSLSLKYGEAAAAFDLPKGDYGTYTYVFRATRLPTPENAATEMKLTEVMRTYKRRDWVQAILVLAVSVLGWWGFCHLRLWGNAPRQWMLKFAAGDRPEKPSAWSTFVSRATEVQLGEGHADCPEFPRWGAWKMRKELRFSVGDLQKLYEKSGPKGKADFAWLRGGQNPALIVYPDGMRDPSLEESAQPSKWKLSTPQQLPTPLYSYTPSADQREQGAKSLHVWVERTDESRGALVASIVLFVIVAAANLYHAAYICQVIDLA